MKRLFSAATLAAVFMGLAMVSAGTPYVKKSKSNVSNNKTNPAKGEVCDDGNTHDGDGCTEKVNKDLNTDPYVEGKVVSPRDPASGMPTGKSASTSTAPTGTASEGCCPGRCCPPEQTGAARNGTKLTKVAISGSGEELPKESRLEPPKTAVGAVDTEIRSSASTQGCCPGRCCPPDAQDHAINTKGTGTAGVTGQDDPATGMAINEKGLPGDKVRKPVKSSK